MQETVTVLLSAAHGAEPKPVQIPARVRNVRVGAVLGEGASGVVLSGFDEALNRKVAVKVLHRRKGGSGDSTLVELASGVKAAAKIRHPNILTIHSVEAAGGFPVIIMELVDGASLARLLGDGGAFGVPLAAYVMRAVTSAVAALHGQNVVHRDLKPANVLFDREGVARVCDFGLACEFDVAAYRGHAVNIGGSPLYMAPEMFEGHVSPQSDVYALGVMLFELLAGVVPFSAPSINELKMCHESRPVPVWELERRDISDELCEIVNRALRKQRFMRYKSAEHMLRALEHVASGDAADDALRMEISKRVVGLDKAAEADGKRVAERPPARTTFDLLARRAREKRERNSE